MRTFVATYRVGCEYSLDRFFDIPNTKEIKYKFDEAKDGNTICYLTIIANNRLELRILKQKALKVLKGLGKVELIVGVG